MTYDELLANIKYITGEFWVRINTKDSELLNAGNALSALKAVVELHLYETHQIEEKRYEFCNHCQTAWPCLTIQVIEKELL